MDILAAIFSYLIRQHDCVCTRGDGFLYALVVSLYFIFLGPLARDDLVQPGEIIVGFWGEPPNLIRFVRLIRFDLHYQTLRLDTP